MLFRFSSFDAGLQVDGEAERAMAFDHLSPRLPAGPREGAILPQTFGTMQSSMSGNL
jgi:hypothetical protein